MPTVFLQLDRRPGMKLLLNVELRERRGLVIPVESSVTRFTSGGLMTIYFGCDAEDTARLISPFADAQHRNLPTCRQPGSRAVFARQNASGSGQLAIASENRENRIMGLAREVLYTGHNTTDIETTERIEAITAEEIRQRASRLIKPAHLIL